MSKLVTFGEVMGRLSPNGYLRVRQADQYSLTFAGSEANVAVAVANFGGRVAFVSKLPQNDLAERALFALRGFGVDTRHIMLGGERLGLYFVEKGASQRPSKVLYDRKCSSFASAVGADFDWDSIFEDATWFHFSGITPALSKEMPSICHEALAKAKEKKITVSCDLNYRKNLWTSEKANRVMSELMPYVDICIANEEDSEKVFGIMAPDTDISSGKLDQEGYRKVAQQLLERFGFKMVALTLRESISASDNRWSGMLYDGENFYSSRKYLIHLVDRVGGGDSFAGGLVYALMSHYPHKRAIEFAVATSCIKQATEYDFSIATVEEINRLVDGNSSGRVLR